MTICHYSLADSAYRGVKTPRLAQELSEQQEILHFEPIQPNAVQEKWMVQTFLNAAWPIEAEL
jgi:hypothetical protein